MSKEVNRCASGFLVNKGKMAELARGAGLVAGSW